MNQGKLIVFEGTDGSGKRTQMQLLVDYFKKVNIPHETVDFPRYGVSPFGDLAGKMLAGELGPVEQIPAHLAALPYACDRWLAKDDLTKWLNERKIIISNRYTASSAVYQAAKLGESERRAFIDWVFMIEQETIGLPKENLTMYLKLPAHVSQKLIEQKDHRTYLAGKKKDLYEDSHSMQETVAKLYDVLARQRPGWVVVDCMEGEALREPSEIHKDIVDVLAKNKVF